MWMLEIDEKREKKKGGIMAGPDTQETVGAGNVLGDNNKEIPVKVFEMLTFLTLIVLGIWM